YEELLADAEKTRRTGHAKLRIASSRSVAPEFLSEVRAWLVQAICIDDAQVRSALAGGVDEYAPMGSRPPLRVVDGGVKLKAGADGYLRNRRHPGLLCPARQDARPDRVRSGGRPAVDR